MSDTGTASADVIVIGAGPVGLALTLDLARRGIAVRLVEREEERFEGSRAKGVQPRTLEVLDGFGLAAAALAAGGAYPPMGLHFGPFTKTWRMHATAPDGAGTPYPDVLLLPQYATTALLHGAVRRLGGDVEFGVRAEEITQDAGSCAVRLGDGRLLTARYVVGADGGASTVRKAAGIAFEGTTDEADRTILVDAAVDGLSHDHWHIWPRTGGRGIAACPLPGADGRFQIMIGTRPGDPIEPAALTEARLADLLRRRAGRSLTLRDISWASVFRPNVRLAERYRNGRLLLCGDAAHVHTPAGAQGLNTGVQDAHNLGWKLHQVLAGADTSLLDSYERERRPVAARVLGRSAELYEGLAAPAPVGSPGAPENTSSTSPTSAARSPPPAHPAPRPCAAATAPPTPDCPGPPPRRPHSSTSTGARTSPPSPSAPAPPPPHTASPGRAPASRCAATPRSRTPRPVRPGKRPCSPRTESPRTRSCSSVRTATSAMSATSVVSPPWTAPGIPSPPSPR
ncbi:FAD-dependent monooxygenase [Streptomyces sp. NK15101]|uniref:FAD-dependent monooxygenase n=1 Tax=Streptomyces sp. NK15101 TaxID=2873261 RepID=UPI001CEC296A|nr:FAD-dependent monooxygenase [Streptomyces sp. NK15101]